MMSDAYSLPQRKALICRIAGAIFLVLAGLNVVDFGTWLIGPAPHVYCDDSGCRWKSEPLTLLDEEDRAIVEASPENGRRFADYVARPRVRAILAGIRLLEGLPFSFLVLGVGLALRRLGGQAKDPLVRALPWLRRASLAAIVWTISRLIADSLTATALMPGMPNDNYYFYFSADWSDAGPAMMLAIAAYATVWALEAGVRAQRDLAEIV